MRWILILIRLPLVLIFVLLGFLVIFLLHILAGKHWFQRPSGKRVINLWMTLFAFIVGLKIHVRGQPHPGLLAANHISWLDIIALDAVIASRFVSKDDVMSWPVIGLLPKWSGTFFLQRGSAAAVSRLNSEIVEALQQQSTVAVFPEGTTHDGEQVHRFFSALLQAGIDSGATVQAVAIRYSRDGEPDVIAPFINDHNIVTHLLSVLGTGRIDVYLDFLEAFVPHDIKRKALAELLHDQIALEFTKPVEKLT